MINGDGGLSVGALLRDEDLSSEDTSWAMGEIYNWRGHVAQIAAFTVAMRARIETLSEIL